MMKKMTIVLNTINDFPQNYGVSFDKEPLEKDIWEILLKNLPKKTQYLKHFRWNDWKPYDLPPPMTIEECGKNLQGKPFAQGIKRGDLIQYLDIYYQDK